MPNPVFIFLNFDFLNFDFIFSFSVSVFRNRLFLEIISQFLISF